MKNYSAKSFLSFFICVVICIQHTSHSLSTSHILRKRMGTIVVTGKEALETPEIVEPTINGSKGFRITATNDMKGSTGSHWFSRPRKLDQGELHLDREWSWLTSSKDRLVQVFQRLRRVLSEFPQNLRNFFRNPRVDESVKNDNLFDRNPGLSEAPGLVKADDLIDGKLNRPMETVDSDDPPEGGQIQVDEVKYDNFFDQNPGLLELVEDDESIDEKVDWFMEKFKLNDAPEGGKEESLQLSTEEKVKQIKYYLHKLHIIQDENSENIAQMETTHTELSAKIKPMLLNWNEEMDATAVPAERLSAYQFKSLAHDQKRGLMFFSLH
ncbi:hypothetical protein PCASD_24585 [Puccinia coronata f. sp. avenae]|uniref:Uncharacterized protein n=2 Tax=Puccinia coronata f. sp. avenae TaxID=200324 RepID=A0A2N5S3V0_9BASI|nr:hypothetical protein PCASD_24585 [Puccinia coronata f. sp. avenae]